MFEYWPAIVNNKRLVDSRSRRQL